MGWRALGDSAWLFVATAGETFEKLAQILRMRRQLEFGRIPQVRDLVSSFDSLAVHFNPRDGEAVMEWLKSIEIPAALEDVETSERTHEIPLRYGDDLDKVAKRLGRTVDEVIRLHSSATYTVAAIGFSPGFPYLIGLPEELRLPRLDTPRPVSAGSVAIAGDDATMRATMRLALEHGVAIGAHPGYEDRENMGRRPMDLPPSAIYDLVSRQLEHFARITNELGADIHHVKAHGALYNQADADPLIANTVANAIRDMLPEIIIYAPPNGCMMSAAKSAGLRFRAEGFIDRRTTPMVHWCREDKQAR
jgi:KipI family sensor histidine kinase inhibitor